MKVISPGQIIKLWLVYQENGINITGLTDLTVTAKDQNENIVLSQPLTEIGSTGEYIYNWNTASISLENTIRVYYKKGEIALTTEEYYVDVVEDQDGMII